MHAHGGSSPSRSLVRSVSSARCHRPRPPARIVPDPATTYRRRCHYGQYVKDEIAFLSLDTFDLLIESHVIDIHGQKMSPAAADKHDRQSPREVGETFAPFMAGSCRNIDN